jgi:hypothetical protein
VFDVVGETVGALVGETVGCFVGDGDVVGDAVIHYFNNKRIIKI